MIIFLVSVSTSSYYKDVDTELKCKEKSGELSMNVKKECSIWLDNKCKKGSRTGMICKEKDTKSPIVFLILGIIMILFSIYYFKN